MSDERFCDRCGCRVPAGEPYPVECPDCAAEGCGYCMEAECPECGFVEIPE